MTIRLSGMSSGLDTDAIVSELVKAYSKKTDTYKGEQKKLSWKTDMWSDLNKKTKSFFSKLSAFRFSGAYNLKKTTVSDSTKASVKATNSAINGTQSLNITSLAKTGYLTGGTLKTNTGAKASGSTKLSNLGFTGEGSGSITVGAGDKSTSISVDGDMTVSQLVDKLKSAGVNASFDETNQRIFVSSTKSGKDNDFTLTADDANGAKALKSFGLLVKSNSATELDSKYAALVQGEGESDGDYNTRLTGLLTQYNQNAKLANSLAPTATSNITEAQKYISANKTVQTLKTEKGIDNLTDLDILKKANDKLYTLDGEGSGTTIQEAYSKHTDSNGNVFYTKDSETEANGWTSDEDIEANATKYYAKTGDDGEGNTVTQLVTDKEAEFNAEAGGFVKTGEEYLKAKYDGLTTEDISSYRSAQAAIESFNTKAAAEIDGEGANTSVLKGTDYESYTLNSLKDSIDAEGADLDAISSSLTAAVSSIATDKEAASVATANSSYLKSYAEQYAATDETDTVLQNLKDRISQAVTNLGFGAGDYSEGAVRVDASDATIYLNGAKFTSDSNNFSINGLTINAMATTTTEERIASGKADDDALSITTDTDAQRLYDSIKDLFSEYNSLINEMTSHYNAASAKGYDMLSDDERSEMTDDQVEKWESKIKASLLRNDTTLNSLISTMSSALSGQYSVNGKNYSLASFGIQTLGLTNSEKNEQNAYHIYGDPDDDSVSDREDKLLAMINKDPEAVSGFFQQVFQKLYTNISDKMASSSMSSSMTIYNDKEMAKEYSSWNKTISNWEKKVTDMEDSYYKKFSAMETALAKLQNSTSSLTSYFGG